MNGSVEIELFEEDAGIIDEVGKTQLVEVAIAIDHPVAIFRNFQMHLF
jgi:hypothetical protein